MKGLLQFHQSLSFSLCPVLLHSTLRGVNLKCTPHCTSYRQISKTESISRKLVLQLGLMRIIGDYCLPILMRGAETSMLNILKGSRTSLWAWILIEHSSPLEVRIEEWYRPMGRMIEFSPFCQPRHAPLQVKEGSPRISFNWGWGCLYRETSQLEITRTAELWVLRQPWGPTEHHKRVLGRAGQVFILSWGHMLMCCLLMFGEA